MPQKRKRIVFDQERKLYVGQFHEFKQPSGKPTRLVLITKADLLDSLHAQGKEINDTNRNRLLQSLYEKKFAELQEKEVIRKETTIAKKSPPIRDVMQLWLDHLHALRRKAKTIQHYKTTVNYYISAVGNHCINDFQIEYQQKYNAYLIKSGIAPVSHAAHIRQIRNFFRWSLENGFIDRVTKWTMPDLGKKDPGIYSDLDLQRIEKSIDAKIAGAITPARKNLFMNHKRAFQMLMWTAMRAGEVWALTLESIDLDRRIIQIKNNVKLNWEPKKKKQMAIVIPEKLFEFLSNDIKKRGFNEELYLDDGNGNPIWRDIGHMTHAFQRYNRVLGIKGVKALHGYRATRLTNLLSKGVDLGFVQQIARHEDISTTLSYVRKDQLPLKQEIDRVDNL